MKFLRLNDPLISVLFENDEIVAIDKPYGIDAHTNDSKVGNEELLQPGLIELFEKQLDTKLHIVHRLDRTTTGVIVFAKSLEAAKLYQSYFRNRETKKTYVFVTDRESIRAQLATDREIIHKGAHLDAKTEFTRLSRSHGFELWQANPFTGRNHQIRIHSAEVGIPILGDPKYGGSEFPFLCLHNHRIDFPNGVTIEAEPPVYFTDLSLLKDRKLAQMLFEVDRRKRLFSRRVDPDQCFRLIHPQRGSERDLGVALDRFGRVLSLAWYKDYWLDPDVATVQRLCQHLGTPILVRFMASPSKGAAREPAKKPILITEAGVESDPSKIESTWVASEGQVKHELRTESQSLGLFLDQRLQRNWVLGQTRGKTVLNLFSYTCGFSVAAALGGAKEVTSVDMSKGALNWGRRNFELNGLEATTAKFLCRNAVSYLEQCLSKSEKFDLIICDPPAFSRGERGIFKIETSLEPLLRSCLQSLNEGGELLFSANAESLRVDDVRRALVKIQAELGLKLDVSSIQAALDFELPGERAGLKSFLIRLRGGT